MSDRSASSIARRRIRVLAGTAALALPRVASAQTREPIRLGQSLPLSGPAAGQGRAFAAGMQLTLDAANRAGGMAGRALQSVALDDALQPSRAHDNVRLLIRDRAVDLIAGMASSESVAAPAIGRRHLSRPCRRAGGTPVGRGAVRGVAGHVSARLIGASPAYFGMSLVPAGVTAQALGSRLRSLVISQVMPYPGSRTIAVVEDFARIAQAAGVPVDYSTIKGYVTGLVAVDALRRAGVNLSPAKLHAALRALRGRFCGVDVSFATSPTGSRFVELVHVDGSGRILR